MSRYDELLVEMKKIGAEVDAYYVDDPTHALARVQKLEILCTGLAWALNQTIKELARVAQEAA